MLCACEALMRPSQCLNPMGSATMMDVASDHSNAAANQGKACRIDNITVPVLHVRSRDNVC
jgi:hypothetical protein